MDEPSRPFSGTERVGLRASEFELLADHGALADYGRTELIDGDIFVMSPQMARHSRAKVRLLSALMASLSTLTTDLEALCEVSVRVAGDSVPEPDIVLTSYHGDRFVPGESAALVIEVSDTTLRIDLGRKAALYAAAGVAEYWVVDLAGACVVQHAGPVAGGYRDVREAPFGAQLVSSAVPGLEVACAGLLQ